MDDRTKADMRGKVVSTDDAAEMKWPEAKS